MMWINSPVRSVGSKFNPVCFIITVHQVNSFTAVLLNGANLHSSERLRNQQKSRKSFHDFWLGSKRRRGNRREKFRTRIQSHHPAAGGFPLVRFQQGLPSHVSRAAAAIKSLWLCGGCGALLCHPISVSSLSFLRQSLLTLRYVRPCVK